MDDRREVILAAIRNARALRSFEAALIVEYRLVDRLYRDGEFVEGIRALLVDTRALAEAQASGDVLGANGVLMDAYDTDVRPLLAEVRAGLGLDPDPRGAYARSGYAAMIEADRIGGQQAGWGA